MMALLTLIGVCAGIAAGLFGIGGGIVIVPALIYWAGFTQHKATGTSLAVLLPPIGLAAALEYYRSVLQEALPLRTERSSIARTSNFVLIRQAVPRRSIHE